MLNKKNQSIAQENLKRGEPAQELEWSDIDNRESEDADIASAIWDAHDDPC